jgi:hypothetical protein
MIKVTIELDRISLISLLEDLEVRAMHNGHYNDPQTQNKKKILAAIEEVAYLEAEEKAKLIRQGRYKTS